MTRPAPRRRGLLLAAILLGGLFIPPGAARAAFMYKKYVVKYDQGHDILCEPYVVKRNDWILKVFKRKGEISYHDFRVFLEIFRRVNPHLQNVDRIRPGEYVLIPLRRLPLDSLPGQSTGTVTIPFVTLSKLPESPPSPARDYLVSRGDTVSALISRQYGAYGTAAYREGIRFFQRLNPNIADLDLIYAGQKIRLPSGEGADAAPPTAPPGAAGGDAAFEAAAPSSRRVKRVLESSMHQAADVLGARLLDKGVYYFPGGDGTEAALDLAEFPVLVFGNDVRILFYGESGEPPAAAKTAAAHWRRLKFCDRSPSDAADRIVAAVMELMDVAPDGRGLDFNDNGIAVTVRAQWVLDRSLLGEDNRRRLCISLIDSPQERTAGSIVRYLEQHDILLKEVVRGKAAEAAAPEVSPGAAFEARTVRLQSGGPREFASGLMHALGFDYTRGAVVSFPYAGIQVEAVTDLISTRDGTPVFVDFGDLHGEAVDAILKTGFNIVQILPQDDLFGSVPGILNAVSVSYRSDAALRAAERKGAYNTYLSLPGYLVEKFGRAAQFLTDTALPAEILHFLVERNITPVLVGVSGP